MSPEQWREFLDSLSPDIKERVKELVRDAMDATEQLIASRFASETTHEYCKHKYDEFRALCAPEVKP